jgi:hypothetical protein
MIMKKYDADTGRGPCEALADYTKKDIPLEGE